MRKMRYATEGLARKAATRQSKESGDVIQAYACSSCGGHHIGHPYVLMQGGGRAGKSRGRRRG